MASPGGLVIGVGNPLRGDDGVGATVVNELRSVAGAGVRLLTCHQLTPELAAPLSEASRAVFVDASAVDAPGTVRCTPVAADATLQYVSHALTPGALVGLAVALYGRAAKAFVVVVGAQSLDAGQGLSRPVEDALPHAVAEVQHALRR